MATEQACEVVVQDVEYQQLAGKSWLARVYQPRGSGPFPAMIDVHGGAWHNGDRMHDEKMAEALAARGILVAALDFRQPPEAGYPASICDINLGTRWLKARAGDFGGTKAIGAIGLSSGGHQVVLSGLRPHYPAYASSPLLDHPEVDATLSYVVACWPVIDPLYRYLFAKRAGREELVSAHLEYWGSEETMAAGSPQTVVEDEQMATPPIFMLLKANDQNHPVEMQERFISTYRKRGGPIQVETFTGLPERGMDASQPEGIRALDMVADFARRNSTVE
jgi:acetyl esterase